ncbi:MAG TPA: hypothetical protein ENK68_04335, partial [Epsilonproteobacteria bacterium]|nr:hypothetical protein [Campylobacterota bacterium]
MDISEQIIHIITRDKSIVYSQKKAEKELLSLLKKLNDSDKKSLKPIIIKLMRQYNKEMFNTNGSQEKYNLACMAGFIMLNYTEYKSHWGVNYDNFLNWYCPSWFSEYYNNDQWMNIGYERLLEYMKKGYLKPSGTKIAQELVNLENSYNDFKRITLTEHIWTLFLYESEVHLTHRYPKFGKLEWKRKLCELSDTKKIDRNKLLTECLLVSTRNFNKIVVGFFLDLFNELTPTNDELLNVQETLFTVLQTQHSKPINQTLKYIKQIHYDPSFNLQDFIEQIPLLLTWDVKAVINGTLSLVDVLARAYPKHKKELMLLAVQTLAQQDETLQTKTIKLISKHKLLADSEIVEEINIYKDGLFHSSKALLPHVAEEHSLAEEVTTITPPQHIREDNRIPSYETFDEMVFFFSQVFEGNNVYDFDLFLHLLPKLKECVNVDNIDRLVPALQRAFKYFQQTVTDEVGNSQILLYT